MQTKRLGMWEKGNTLSAHLTDISLHWGVVCVCVHVCYMYIYWGGGEGASISATRAVKRYLFS